MNEHQKMQAVIQSLQVRSENSFEEMGITSNESVESLESPHEEISVMIEDLIKQEKKKYGASKTDPRFFKDEIKIKTRRFYSYSNFMPQKPIMRLPKHIQRILDSSKKFPNVPRLEKNQNQLDTIYGAFFGFLIGDIIGSYMAYNSGRNNETLIHNALLMNGGGTYGLGAGQGSDQTEIMLTLCYALIQGQGTYNRNTVAKHYLNWFQSKPFNFSAIFALAMRDLRKMRLQGIDYDPKKLGRIVEESSLKNKNQESSIGLIRVLPLALFGLKFNQNDFQRLIKDQMSLICPNELVVESSIVYGKLLRYMFIKKDPGYAFFHASKWVYDNGSSKLMQLWKAVQKGIQIPSRGNLGKLKTSFTYACIQINRTGRNFVESLVRVLERGGDSQITCSIVMTLMGATVGYNSIPGYFKQKIVNSTLRDSPRPRDQIYAPNQILDIMQKLQKVQNQRLYSIH